MINNTDNVYVIEDPNIQYIPPELINKKTDELNDKSIIEVKVKDIIVDIQSVYATNVELDNTNNYIINVSQDNSIPLISSIIHLTPDESNNINFYNIMIELYYNIISFFKKIGCCLLYILCCPAICCKELSRNENSGTYILAFFVIGIIIIMIVVVSMSYNEYNKISNMPTSMPTTMPLYKL